MLASSSCGEPAALQVGRVEYSASDLGVLGEDQQELLADLTALGLAVADERTSELVEPYVERELRALMLQRLAMEAAVEEAGMGDAELREAYLRDPEPELVVRHLVVLSERWRPAEHRDSARMRAVEALRRARAGEDFEAVVREYSDEPGAAARSGLLAPGREGSWVPEFWAAASALDEGDLSGVVETEYGFHVIRLEERRPVPFEEVRGDVLQRFVALPEALAQAQRWSHGMTEEMALDTGAAISWSRGEPERETLVSWPLRSGRGSLTVDELESFLDTQPAEARRLVEGGDSAAIVDFIAGAARNEMLVDRARQRGLIPSASQRAALERRWSEQLARWAELFGFREGQRTSSVKESALDALGLERQEAAIARSEVGSLSGVLRRLYPVRRPSATDPGPG